MTSRRIFVPHTVIAVTRTISFLLVVLIAFRLGEMSTSFTGSHWAWMAIIACIAALPLLSFDLLRVIWTVRGR
jgi:hypothetical protein